MRATRQTPEPNLPPEGETATDACTDSWHDRDTLKAIEQMDNGEGIPLSDIYAYLDTWDF